MNQRKLSFSRMDSICMCSLILLLCYKWPISLTMDGLKGYLQG